MTGGDRDPLLPGALPEPLFFVYTIVMGTTNPKPTMRNTSTNALLASAGSCFAMVCWGSAYVAARYLLHPSTAGLVELSPLLLATLRFSIASLFFVIPFFKAMVHHQVSRRDLLMIVLFGQFTFSLYYWLQYIGIQETTASIASILGVGLIPLFTTILSHLFGAERLNVLLLLALLLGFLGVALIVFPSPLSFPLSSGFLIGALCLVSNTFFFALYTTLSKRWMQTISPMVLTGGTMISGTAGLLLLSCFDPMGNQWYKVALLGWTQWGAVLFLALACSVLSYFIYNFALSKTQASRVTVYFYFEPLVTILLGVLLLGERFSWQTLVGAATIGSSIVLIHRQKK